MRIDKIAKNNNKTEEARKNKKNQPGQRWSLGDGRMREKKEYSDCFVAYLDILGFKERVKGTKKSPESLNTLIEALQINSKFTGTKNTSDGKLDIKRFFFSDSFVFMLKEKEDDLHHLFIIIRYLQDRLWESKLCLRGAITRGKMYWPKKEENILLGPAMIKAHGLESKVAIYPRIIVSQELHEYIENEKIKTWSENGDTPLLYFIKEDKDGVYFFDILNSEITRKKGESIKPSDDGSFSIGWNNNDSNNYDNVVNTVKSLIETGIKDKDETVRQKYKWLNSYLNENSQEVCD